MGGYATLGAANITQSKAFYDAVMAAIGWAAHADYPEWRAYSRAGSGSGFELWVGIPFNHAEATSGNGAMVGFFVDSHAEVDAFHTALMSMGGTNEGDPGPRPGYGPHWYAAYGRDPVGNKIAAVCNTPACNGPV